MRLAIDAGVEPLLLSEGARIALNRASQETSTSPEKVLAKIWSSEAPKEETQLVLSLLLV
jgi:hypothetical protein